MDVTIVIPARYQSSRFPGKPLAPLVGATGIAKTVVARCIDAARAIPGNPRTIVATDDEHIAAEARRHNAEAVMTSAACRNGTERVAEATAALGLETGIIVNLQGDAPLTPPSFVEALVEAMENDASIEVATPVLPFDRQLLADTRRNLAAGRRGPTAVVFGENGDALYFSKQLIPFIAPDEEAQPIFHHVGLYAYRPGALAAYAAAEPTTLELTETLEQLRFLEIGHRIRTLLVDTHDRIAWEVNNPEDVPMVEAQLATLGIA
jgi:3-deoxy-manno-octulosonate cytidylyltransferase (CMP-KDO synthetase)